ncbi:MAG: serine/threonine-protein phosphatase [Cytophagales bacterium]|nr:serine/threonine-protein phosphatase [Armatimonadota bacterium]
MLLPPPETKLPGAPGKPADRFAGRTPQVPALRFAAIGIAVVLFGVLDLVMILLLPGRQRGVAALFSILGAAVILLTLPLLLSFFERQQEQIEQQSREIETLHAMDTAIASELELPRLLEVAVKNAVRAVDGEAAGVTLFHPGTGKLVAEEYSAVGQGVSGIERLRAITRTGRVSHEDLWEALVVPLSVGNDIARISDKRSETPFSGSIGGEPTGYLTAARRRPAAKAFTETDRMLLEALGGTVDVAVANVRALQAARDAVWMKDELAKERRVAQALTEGLLPDIPRQVGRLRFAKRYEAQGDEALVGGDIYDLFPLGAGRGGVVIADVSGKGLAAAKKTAMVKYSLRSYAREHASPGEVLARLNTALFDEPDLTGFVTLLYGVLDVHDVSFHYASAGHETPILRRSDGRYEFLEPTGLVLGAAPEQGYETHRYMLAPGDGLLLYTDGLTEARSATDGKLLEIEGVLRILEQNRQNSDATSVPDVLWASLNQYTGGRMRDDMALLWLECLLPSDGD